MTKATHKTIGCAFENTDRVYTYKTTKMDIKVGDRVMVDTPKNGPTPVTVVEVHETPKPEDKFKIKEILSWIDPAHEV